MSTLIRNALPLLALGLALSGGVLAQAPPVPPASPGGEAPLFDPAQLPSFTGRVQQFTLTPRGEIDGVILSDGTEVKTPPHLSTSMAYSVRPGDTLVIHGLRAAAIPLIQAVAINDQTSGHTLVDSGPEPRGPRAPLPGADGARLTEAQGRVRMPLHGPRGEINGALLTDGTVLRLPPESLESKVALLEPGRPIVAEGTEVANAIGRVIEVSEIGPSREKLAFLNAPLPGPPPPAGGLPLPLPPPPPPPPPRP